MGELGIRIEGLRVLAKYRIEEGLTACVRYVRDQNPWASEKRTPELMEILLSYGAHAQAMIPELEKIADYFAKDEPDFPKHLMKLKAESVRNTIEAIRKAQERPELVRLGAR